MGENYLSYDHSRDELNVEKLSTRRSKLCLKFAKRAEKHKKYSNWFKPEKSQTPNFITRREKYSTKLKYTPVPFRKARYEKSPIPYLTQLLNNHYTKKRK